MSSDLLNSLALEDSVAKHYECDEQRQGQRTNTKRPLRTVMSAGSNED